MKRNGKRLFTLLLSAVMVFMDTVPAFAWDRNYYEAQQDLSNDPRVARLAGMQEQKARKEGDLETLTGEITGLEGDISTLTGRLASIQEEMDGYVTEMGDNQTLLDLKELIDTKQPRIMELQALINEATESGDDEAKAGYQSEKDGLESEIGNAISDASLEESQAGLIEDYRDDLSLKIEKTGQKAEKEAQLSEKNGQKTSLEGEISSLESQISALESEIREDQIRQLADTLQEKAANVDENEITVSSTLKLTENELSEMVASILANDPRLYYVDDCEATGHGDNDIVTAVQFTYTKTAAQITEQNTVISGLKSRIATIEDNLTLTAIYAHDYICQTTSPDATGTDPYDVLVSHKGNADAYAATFELLMYELPSVDHNLYDCSTPVQGINALTFTEGTYASDVPTMLNANEGLTTYVNCYADDEPGDAYFMYGHENMFWANGTSNFDVQSDNNLFWLKGVRGQVGISSAAGINYVSGCSVENDTWYLVSDTQAFTPTAMNAKASEEAIHPHHVYEADKTTVKEEIKIYGPTDRFGRFVSGDTIYNAWDCVLMDGSTPLDDQYHVYTLTATEAHYGELYNVGASTFELGRLYVDESGKYHYVRNNTGTYTNTYSYPVNVGSMIEIARFGIEEGNVPSPTEADPTGGAPTGGAPTGGDPTPGDDPTGGDPTGGDPTPPQKPYEFICKAVTDGLMIEGVRLNDRDVKVITIPEEIGGYTVVEIGPRVLSNAINTEALVLPATLKRMQANALRMSTKLMKVFFKGNAPTIGRNAFYLTNSKMIAFYPANAQWTDANKDVYGNNTVRWVAYDVTKLDEYIGMNNENIPTGTPTGGAPTPGDPTPGDPTPGDPTPGDPTPGDPTPGDPTPGDPTPGDPTPEDPTPGDPTPGDPTPAEPELGEEMQEGDFKYKQSEEYSVLTGYIGTANEITIPTLLGNLPVKMIAAGAFDKQYFRTEVTIPATVTKIGENAFRSCYLKKMTFLGDAPVIAENAFTNIGASTPMTVYYQADNATWTESVKKNYGAYNVVYTTYTQIEPGDDPTPIPQPAEGSDFDYIIENDAVTLQGYKGSSKALIIPEKIEDKKVSVIAAGAFAGTAIESVTIPATVTEIQTSAFARCASLTAVLFEGDAPVIQTRAFSGVTATVKYPRRKSWTEGKRVNYGGTLTWEPYDDPNTPDYGYVKKGDTLTITEYTGSKTELTIPDEIEGYTVTAIDAAAFSGSDMTSVVIPATITQIGDYAFNRCSKLGMVIFEGAAPVIAENAFARVTATVHHPYQGWASEQKKNYGGTLTYEAVGTPPVEPSPSPSPSPTPAEPDKPEPEPKDASLYVEFADGDTYVYTGSAVEPEVNVFYRNERLVAGIDYKVTYTNNVKAGKDASMTVTGITIPGTATHKFTILQKSLSDTDVVVGSIQIKSGTKAKPVLYYRGKALGKSDYTVTGKDTFTKDGFLKVKGTGNFKDTIQIPVKVAEPLKLSVSISAEKHYYDGTVQSLTKDELTIEAEDRNGKEIKPVEGRDYVVLYNGDRVNAGTVKVTVVGIGEYSGSKTGSFKILPLKTSGFDLFADGSDDLTTSFVEGGVRPVITVRSPEGIWLRPGKDFKVSYSSNKKLGTGKFKVTFTGNYKGCKAESGTFTIEEGDFRMASAYCADQVFNGTKDYRVAPVVVMNGKVLNKKNYSVEYSIGKTVKKSDLKDGELIVDVTVTGKGNYEGEITASYMIVTVKDAYDISKKPVAIYDTKTKKNVKTVTGDGNPIRFDGKPYTLNVYKEKDGKKLEEGVDYVLTYMIDQKKGTGMVMVTGIGSYAGSKYLKFKIKAGDINWNEESSES